MKFANYNNAVNGDGLSGWPERHGWISPNPGQWDYIGYYVHGDNSTWHDPPTTWTGIGTGQINGTIYNGKYQFGGHNYDIWWTPNAATDPHEFRNIRAYTDTPTQASQQAQHQAGGRPAPVQGVRQPGPGRPAGGRPAPVQGVRQPGPGRAAPVQGRQPGPGRSGPTRRWVVRGTPPHAYVGSRDLGLMVNDHQVVQPTNGGRLWSLGDLQSDGTVKWLGSFGSVAGAPPPPNAHLNNVPQQYYPPPAQPVYQEPYYPQPQVVYAEPYYPQQQQQQQVVYAEPYYPQQQQVVYAEPYYPQQQQVVYADQVGPPAPGIPGYDPVTGQPLTAAQAAYLGAQHGVEQVLSQQQAALDTSLYLGGGGAMDMMGGGLDMSTLMFLANGDPALAMQYAIDNGGYDPTYGGMLEPLY